jgi:hypothetical protein
MKYLSLQKISGTNKYQTTKERTITTAKAIIT